MSQENTALEKYVDDLELKLVLLCSQSDDRLKILSILDDISSSNFRGRIFPTLAACNNVCLPEEPFSVSVLLFQSRLVPDWYNMFINKLQASNFGESLENVTLNFSQPIQEITFNINSVPFSLKVNDLENVYKSAIFSEINNVIGEENLFKRSYLLVKSWILYEMQRYSAFPITDILQFVKTGAIEVMLMCVFAVSSTTITNAFSALTSFLRFYSTLEWSKWEITACGHVDRQTLRGAESDSSNLNRISAVIEKYQKLWLSSQGAPNHSKSSKFADVGSFSEKGYGALAIMDLLQPGKALTISSFIGIRHSKSDVIAKSLSVAFNLGLDDISKALRAESGLLENIFPNMMFVTNSWHSVSTISNGSMTSSHQILETPDKYIKDMVSTTEFISLGKLTGEEVLRAASQILLHEQKPLKLSELLGILQTETENPHLTSAIKSLGGLKRIVSTCPGIIHLGDDNGTGNPLVYLGMPNSRINWYYFSPLVSQGLEISKIQTIETSSVDTMPLRVAPVISEERYNQPDSLTLDDLPRPVDYSFTNHSGSIPKPDLNPTNKAFSVDPFARRYTTDSAPQLDLQMARHISPAQTAINFSQPSVVSQTLPPPPGFGSGMTGRPPTLESLNDIRSPLMHGESPLYTSFNKSVPLQDTSGWAQSPSRTIPTQYRDTTLAGLSLSSGMASESLSSALSSITGTSPHFQSFSPSKPAENPMARRVTISQMPSKPSPRPIIPPNVTAASGATIVDPATGAKVFNPTKPEVWVPGKFASQKANSTTPSASNYTQSHYSGNFDPKAYLDESNRRPTFPMTAGGVGQSPMSNSQTQFMPQTYSSSPRSAIQSGIANPQLQRFPSRGSETQLNLPLDYGYEPNNASRTNSSMSSFNNLSVNDFNPRLSSDSSGHLSYLPSSDYRQNDLLRLQKDDKHSEDYNGIEDVNMWRPKFLDD